MNRAFSSLVVRSVSEDERLIEGIASTPATDRVGDVVEPMGAVFKLPLPLLLDHDHTLAVGEVEEATATATGITFKARIRKIDEEGDAKQLVDRAWHYVKHGLRKFVSIGFRPLEHSYLDGGGLHFTKWDWLELSAVTVPAHAEARITAAKALGASRPIVGADRVVKLTEAQRRFALAAGKAREDRERINRIADEIGVPRPTTVVRL